LQLHEDGDKAGAIKALQAMEKSSDDVQSLLDKMIYEMIENLEKKESESASEHSSVDLF